MFPVLAGKSRNDRNLFGQGGIVDEAWSPLRTMPQPAQRFRSAGSMRAFHGQQQVDTDELRQLFPFRSPDREAHPETEDALI